MTVSRSKREAPWRIALPLPIRTERLLLRPCREGDGVALAAAIAESFDALQPWFHDGMRAYEDEISDVWQEVVACRSLACFKSRDRLQFLVCADEKTLIGSVELFDPDWNRRSFRLAYWIRPSFARRGYMTEAATAVLKYTFSVLEARRITVGHAATNEASARLVRKLGFGRRCVMPLGSEMPDGRFVDGVSYVMTDASSLPDLRVTWGRSARQGATPSSVPDLGV